MGHGKSLWVLQAPVRHVDDLITSLPVEEQLVECSLIFDVLLLLDLANALNDAEADGLEEAVVKVLHRLVRVPRLHFAVAALNRRVQDRAKTIRIAKLLGRRELTLALIFERSRIRV